MSNRHACAGTWYLAVYSAMKARHLANVGMQQAGLWAPSNKPDRQTSWICISIAGVLAMKLVLWPP
jgi:hypothetical protein